MQDLQEPMAHPSELPKLPGMLFRSLFTVARNDPAAATATQVCNEFNAPALSQAQVGRYKDAFNGFVSDVPLTIMYCLAQRVHLAQMLDEAFPWPAPGLVHVSNELELHAPIELGEEFFIRANIDLPARGPAVSPRRLRPVFNVEFWQKNTKVVTCVSQYQVMPKQGQKSQKPREKKVATALGEDWQQLTHWQLDTTAGRTYARLSGDFNPIHLHPLLSRWFGFEKPIIHGMYMAGRAQAELERAYQKPVQRIDVSFKRPVPLPADIALWQKPSADDNNGLYQICGAADHLQRLEGSFTLQSK
ncbi:MaoC/PaaZ C-terminal domain-containing protein [Pseudidiomarina sp. E22-M8]|uniref:MaoC/PaaZ C-terminal domain-containing protein n=1 Tax=Pseudidiomarina sp. E22-M8 TaxID=3424768 RepID=UPI00403D0522